MTKKNTKCRGITVHGEDEAAYGLRCKNEGAVQFPSGPRCDAHAAEFKRKDGGSGTHLKAGEGAT